MFFYKSPYIESLIVAPPAAHVEAGIIKADLLNCSTVQGPVCIYKITVDMKDIKRKYGLYVFAMCTDITDKLLTSSEKKNLRAKTK